MTERQFTLRVVLPIMVGLLLGLLLMALDHEIAAYFVENTIIALTFGLNMAWTVYHRRWRG